MDSNICQINKPKTVHTLQCTLYTVHYVPYRQEFSTLETSQERGHVGEMHLTVHSCCILYNKDRSLVSKKTA